MNVEQLGGLHFFWDHKPRKPNLDGFLCEDTDVLHILSCFYRCSAGGLVPYGSQTLGYIYLDVLNHGTSRGGLQ